MGPTCGVALRRRCKTCDSEAGVSMAEEKYHAAGATARRPTRAYFYDADRRSPLRDRRQRKRRRKPRDTQLGKYSRRGSVEESGTADEVFGGGGGRSEGQT